METVAAYPEADLSIVGMFLNADVVVQSVMIGLALSSVLCWLVIFEKLLMIRAVRRENVAFDGQFWTDLSPDVTFRKFKDKKTVGKAAVFCAAMRELGDGVVKTNERKFVSMRERVDRVMGVQVHLETHALRDRLFILAIVGSAGPFIGLFGTVWGIMNSFKSIATSGASSLAVVAPGLAEALFATTLGLMAAIPSVIAYNILMNRCNDLTLMIANFAEELSTIIARRLEEV